MNPPRFRALSWVTCGIGRSIPCRRHLRLSRRVVQAVPNLELCPATHRRERRLWTHYGAIRATVAHETGAESKAIRNLSALYVRPTC